VRDIALQPRDCLARRIVLVGAVVLLKWVPAVIGILTIIAMVVRPRDWPFSDPQPPRFPRLQSRWSRLVRR